jgi:hypothetical protein
MLESGFGIGDLIEAAKRAYLRAAIAQEFPRGSRINASRLSVRTGLTRKEVSALIHQIAGKRPIPEGNLKGQRALRVLRGWLIDPRFSDAKGEPARLCLRGDRHSFSLLVKLYSGDVTPNSVLKELERMKVVTLTKAGELRLRRERVRPQSTENLLELARLFSDFAKAVSQRRSSPELPLFFGFRDTLVGSSNQASRFQRTFSNRAAVLLSGVEQWLASQTPLPPTEPPESQRCRVGIGVYLVRQDVVASQPSEASRHAHRTRTPRQKPGAKLKIGGTTFIR